MNYQTKTSLILPFKGTWIVGNGGRSEVLNNHYNTSPDQQYAYDFIKPHNGDGEELEDYEAFSSEVIAPSDGIVCEVISSFKDLPIGKMDDENLAGNMIIIDHQNGEFSMLCHLKYDSIIVREGNPIKQGDLIGLCGNTGNTSEPHIHYQLQDNAIVSEANGLPAQFSKIIVNGEIKENFELERNQKVSNLN